MGEIDRIGEGTVVRAVCIISLVGVLAGCAGFEQRCRSLGLSGNSSGYALCVNEQQVALETTLVSIANGLATR